MKVFNRDKYVFRGVASPYEPPNYFFIFENVVPGHKPELVFVHEAKMVYPDGGFVYFDEDACEPWSCVNHTARYFRDLLFNEERYCRQKGQPMVKLLYEEVECVGAARPVDAVV